MIILTIIVGSLLAIATGYGLYQRLGTAVLFEINMLSSPYYHFGISFFGEPHSKNIIAEKLIIGLVFFNVVIIFYKVNDEN
jgi:hypothetical protein